MGRCSVVIPELVRLPLSGGDFIDVKKELNAGEYWDLLTALAERKKFAKILTYVVSWSLCGVGDQPLPYSLDDPEATRLDTLSNLKKARLRELIAVLDRHETAVDAEVKKKEQEEASTPPGEPASLATSGSVA